MNGRNFPIEFGVRGFVELAHAAGSEFCRDVIVADVGADQVSRVKPVAMRRAASTRASVGASTTP